MPGSLDKVLQSDGTYKWEVVEHAGEAVSISKKKISKPRKKKTTPSPTSTTTETDN